MSFHPGRRLAISAISVFRGWRLDENHVGAGRDIGRGAIDGGGEAFDGDGVGSRDDDEVGVVQGIAHGFELLHHLGRRHEALVVVMTALLRKGLILEMEGGDAGALEGARGGLGIERIAVTGIGVGDDRRRNDIHHRSQPVGDRAHREEPEIRHAGRARDGAAAGVNRRKSRLLDQPRRQPVERARRDRDAARRQQCPQFRRGAHDRLSASPSLARHDTSYAAARKRRGKSMKRGAMKRGVLAALAVLFGTLSAAAQHWPTTPVRIIVPFAAGATPDLVAPLDRRSSARQDSSRRSSSRTSRAPAAIPAPMPWPRPRPTARPSASASAARSPSTRCCSAICPTIRRRISRSSPCW